MYLQLLLQAKKLNALYNVLHVQYIHVCNVQYIHVCTTCVEVNAKIELKCEVGLAFLENLNLYKVRIILSDS